MRKNIAIFLSLGIGFIIGIGLLIFGYSKISTEASDITGSVQDYIGNDLRNYSDGILSYTQPAPAGSTEPQTTIYIRTNSDGTVAWTTQDPTAPNVYWNESTNGLSTNYKKAVEYVNSQAKRPTANKTTSTVKPVALDSKIKFDSLNQLISEGIPGFLITFVGLVGLIFFFINAFRYLISAGNDEATTEAKRGMLYAVIGLVIALSAYLIVKFIGVIIS